MTSLVTILERPRILIIADPLEEMLRKQGKL
jgi:hypothetical protein